MSDWAEDKAREWLERSGGHLEGGEPCIPLEYGWVPIADYSIASLAALLREVATEAVAQYYFGPEAKL